MEQSIKMAFENMNRDLDPEVQRNAFIKLVQLTEEKVDWAYEVWRDLENDLVEGDNHERSRAAQLLCNLAVSDPEERIFKVFPKIWDVTKDKKFVTARHSLKSIWKIALAGDKQKQLVLNALADKYIHSTDEKNYTLIRYDIIESLRKLYDKTEDEQIKQLALEWIELEEDVKYKKKYASVWKNIS